MGENLLYLRKLVLNREMINDHVHRRVNYEINHCGNDQKRKCSMGLVLLRTDSLRD